MSITIKGLARELNLSVSTISKALTDSHEISSETKQRVLELARKLNYKPNPYASSLRRRRSKTIAVVLPAIADSFFSLAINGIEAAASDKDYHVLIYLTHESFAKEEAMLDDFQHGRVDGILISVSRETAQSKHIQDVMNNGIPVVFFDRIIEEIATTKVTTNDFESSYQATSHLIQQGCKRLCYLGISKDLSISNTRMEGYKKALTDNGLPVEESNILYCTNEDEADFQLIKKTLKGKKRPDGIVASVEKLTTPVYVACEELGLSIPDDVKVLSFSNLYTAPILNPALTTVTQPAFEMGQKAAEILLKCLGKKNSKLDNESIVIPSSLTIRASTL
ncbi:transcriptional regulator, LacI family [Filimonas lacunae]|uniref:Transcriptional regulator, LacI family n=1 Tax=Filimonas lacunae TaxID=477680 RepID=A0A173MMU2_9BACT|nr:LacI family DNA-binding transcriptional regulator [Filimonas lacunae]BAV08954.1 LacI family transcriptional regulator [Filimonas lacunae]SIS64677.1 transcriptional regulator, LacI family [Filimonas lacunae]